MVLKNSETKSLMNQQTGVSNSHLFFGGLNNVGHCFLLLLLCRFCFLCFVSAVSFTGSYTEIKPHFVILKEVYKGFQADISIFLQSL